MSTEKELTEDEKIIESRFIYIKDIMYRFNKFDNTEEDFDTLRAEISVSSMCKPVVRTDWYDPTECQKSRPHSYRMIHYFIDYLLVEIVGDLDESCQPVTAKIVYRGRPKDNNDWLKYELKEDDTKVLISYMAQFRF